MPNKLIYSFIKEQFKHEGYILIDNVYINSKNKLSYICPKGTRHFISWSKWKQGRRCPCCSPLVKYNINNLREDFNKEDCTLLSNVYLGSKQTVDYKCNICNTINYVIVNTWKNKRNKCKKCTRKKNSNLKLNEFKDLLLKEKYSFIKGEYKTNRSIITTKCKNNHKYVTSRFNWVTNKVRCPKCSNNGTSKFEQEVKDFIFSLDQNIIENDRTTIMGNKGKHLELDILFPCKTKAIECNGVYWHDRPEAVERDKIKNEQCKDLGINLLNIDYNEWYKDKEKYKLIIKNFCTK